MTKTRKELGALIAELQEKQKARAKSIADALTRPVLKNKTLMDQLDELPKEELQEVARRMADNLGAIIADVHPEGADAVPAQPDQRQSEPMGEDAADANN